jgi:hypothetical protein
MILVITPNGNEYITEDAVQCVRHDRERHLAHIYQKGDAHFTRTITDVEHIKYIRGNSDLIIKEDRSEMVELAKRYAELRDHASKMRAIVFELQRKNIDLYDEIVKELFKDDPPKVNPGD